MSEPMNDALLAVLQTAVELNRRVQILQARESRMLMAIDQLRLLAAEI